LTRNAPIIISSAITFLYLSALAGYLKLGADILLVFCVFGLLVAPFYLRKKRDQIFTQYLTPGFVITLLILVFLSYFSLHTGFSQWDEFSHWGPHAKLIFYHHGLWGKDIVVNHKSYPPGSELFYYLFFRVFGYSEQIAYLAQIVLTITPLSILASNISWRHWGKACAMLCATILVLGLVLQFRFGPTNILYKDQLVGVFFGMGIVSYLYSKRHAKDILMLIPMVFAMSLFKLKLLPLVLVMTVVIASECVIDLMYEKGAQRKEALKKLFAVISLPIASLIASLTWSHYLKEIQENAEWVMKLDIHSLLQAFTAEATTRHQQVLNNFIMALKWPAKFSGVIAMGVCIVAWLNKNNIVRGKIILRHLIMLLGLAGYLFGLLLLYLYVFSDYEGIGLASFYRYLSIYLIGWLLVFLSDVYQVKLSWKIFTSPKFSHALGVAIGVIFIAASSMTYVKTLRANTTQQKVKTFQKEIQVVTNAAKKLIPPDSKVFIVWQNTTGFPYEVVLYQLAPRSPNLWCFSLGKRHFKNDYWTCEDSKKQFSQRLNKYDYLLLAHTDKNFRQHFGSVIPKSAKPIASYEVCQSKTFNPDYTDANCKKHLEHAYLFKIQHEGSIEQQVNVVKQPR